MTFFFWTEKSRLRHDHAILFLHSGHCKLDLDHCRRRHWGLPFALLPLLLHLALHLLLLQVNDVTYFMMSHISWCHIFHDVTHFMMSHISWCHTFHDVTYFMMSHISWCHTFYDVTRFMMSHISWCHKFSGRSRP